MVSHNDSSEPGSNTWSQITRHLKSGRSKALGLGFAGAVAVISLAGAYAIYGDTTGKQFDTSSSSNSYHPEDGTGSPQTAETEEGENMGTENQGQPDEDRQQGAESSSSSQSATNVTVNGRKVDVPANGSYSQTTDDGVTRTEIRTNSNHSSTTTGNSSSNSNSSSVNINISSGDSTAP